MDNQTNPSYRLSDDTLFLIFKLVESSYANTLQPVKRKVPFNISLVSKRWRQLALDMPSLWTKIDPVNVRMLPTLIERSKGSPLVIEFLHPYWHMKEYCIDPDQPGYPGFLIDTFNVQVERLDQYIEQLLPYIDRWKHFKVRIHSNVNLEGLCSPAPELRAFYLSSSGKIRLPATLFQAHTPQLHAVNLSRAHIPLSSAIYTNLKQLQLDYSHHILREDKPLSQLIRNIASCPLLEYLRLKAELFIPLPETQKPQISIDLLHLRHLLLELEEPNVIHILSSFLFPALLQLNMVLHLSRADPRLTSMGTNIVERLPILTRVRSMRVTFNLDSRRFTVTGRDGLWHEANTSIFNALYSIASFLRVNLVESLLPAFGEQFPFPALEELYFQGFRYAVANKDPLLFVRTLLNFPTITCLTLKGCPSSFLEALFVDSKSPSHPCPLLERLAIFDPHPDLIRIVKSRLENPHYVAPLRYLTIIGSRSVDANTMLALQGLPIHVEVKDDHLDGDWKPEWPKNDYGSRFELD